MTTVVDPAFIAAVATLLTAVAALIKVFQTSNTVDETHRQVAAVHAQTTQATNGQHDELVRNNQELLRRVEKMEEEINTIYRAFTEQLERRGQRGRLRWRKDMR